MSDHKVNDALPLLDHAVALVGDCNTALDAVVLGEKADSTLLSPIRHNSTVGTD